jgi:hypothetical protein
MTHDVLLRQDSNDCLSLNLSSELPTYESSNSEIAPVKPSEANCPFDENSEATDALREMNSAALTGVARDSSSEKRAAEGNRIEQCDD